MNQLAKIECETQDGLKVSRRKFHKTNMKIPQKFMKGMAPSRGEKGEVVTELHLPFPSHINFTTLTDVIYNIFLRHK